MRRTERFALQLPYWSSFSKQSRVAEDFFTILKFCIATDANQENLEVGKGLDRLFVSVIVKLRLNFCYGA